MRGTTNSSNNEDNMASEGQGISITSSGHMSVTNFESILAEELRQNIHKSVALSGLGLALLPEDLVDKLSSFSILNLYGNSLSQLPRNFTKLVNVRELDLHSNRFTEIPQCLLNLPNIEKLDLSNNSICKLPQDFPLSFCEQIRVLSLKNNKLTQIKLLYPLITQLKQLVVLDIEGNLFPEDVLNDILQGYSPSQCSTEEYWLNAIKRYFVDNPISAVSQVAISPGILSATPDSQQKIARAAKRMGFIGNSSSNEDNDIKTTSPPTDDLYSHTKFNEYFKRLSVLPEEPVLQENEEALDEQAFKELLQTHHEKKQKSMENIVLACRKLLFTFTECQQNIRKITSLCTDKTISVNIISQLYSLKSHIDNLVEVLEEFESNSQNKESSANQTQILHQDVLIKLCLTILTIFKKIVGQLRKNFSSFFGNNDVFFVRVFYMNILCSYTEIFNAWNLITLDNSEKMKKKKLSKTHSYHFANTTQYQKHVNNRQKSSVLHRSPSINGVSPQQSNLTSVSNPGLQGSALHSSQPTPPIQSGSYSVMPISNLSTPPPVSDASPKPVRNGAYLDQNNHSISSQNDVQYSLNQNTSSGDMDIDLQLYQTLFTVVDMVNVVYSQLTKAITKSAIASTNSDQPSITSVVAAKTKDLTDTCFQSMELSRILKERLEIISSSEEGIYSTNKEKQKTWEDINAFLKSIIAILANAKDIMSDLPTLNDVRPNLGSLAKITKDVTVILDLSSYKNVSSAAQQTYAHTANSNANLQMTSSSQVLQVVQPSDGIEHNTSYMATPLSTPSLVTSHMNNPFEQL